MADSLSKVPDVEIDPEGKFKYILVRVKVKGGTDHKDIVRGTKSAEYHNHIFEKVNPAMEALGLESSCLGGGKIEHNSKEKKLRVFGESTDTCMFGIFLQLLLFAMPYISLSTL
ncbi:hypothetical protein NFI96_033201 [Prochilodus magdalenae]|nr:hypothetical protein NFI96_033201 [Prochilodus magdalenae]